MLNRIFNRIFNRKKKWSRPTVDFIEQKYNIKIQYPTTFLPNKEWTDEETREIGSVGCIDLMWGPHWIHQDCFSRKCNECSFYPCLEKYQKEHGTTGIADVDKAMQFLNGA